MDEIATILDLARWAPSGDNAQPWRFLRLDEARVQVAIRDQSSDCIYERDGRGGLVAAGILLETMRLAATTVGRRLMIDSIAAANPRAPVITVSLLPDPEVRPDPLALWITARSVNRGRYATRDLRPGEVAALQAAVAPGFSLQIAGGTERRAWAWLNLRAARLRLDTREGWELMRRVIAWDAAVSADRMPDRALGLPRCMLGIARRQFETWSWERTRFVNRCLGGTWVPRLLLEWWPGLRCSAHLALRADVADDSLAGWLRAGAAVQRLWLTATSLGLQHQPGFSPLAFARYARDGIAFSTDPRAPAAAGRLANHLRRLLGPDALEHVVWMGRIGEAGPPPGRSTRLPLAVLCAPHPEVP